MLTTKPLTGETIVLTGTAMTHAIQTYIESLGGRAIYAPLIEVRSIAKRQLEQMLPQIQSVNWLIITSQNAVAALQQVNGFQYTKHLKIAAVGEKTAAALTNLGVRVDFVPTTYSADTMLREFPVYLAPNDRCLFLKGSKAKNTIEQLPCEVITWTVYETVPCETHLPRIAEIIQRDRTTIVFASPSAVEVYNGYGENKMSWHSFQSAAIGHITKSALEAVGVKNIISPTTYTMRATIDEIVKRKDLFK